MPPLEFRNVLRSTEQEQVSLMPYPGRLQPGRRTAVENGLTQVLILQNFISQASTPVLVFIGCTHSFRSGVRFSKFANIQFASGPNDVIQQIIF
ncbi:unnamed protein product [Clavelina lepadiformis]|uniref:Uncharacterized protein n=1 Tax=Clavelina lepadiformis TaxID=159417 RepID=A0ABP0GUX1_CLALP